LAKNFLTEKGEDDMGTLYGALPSISQKQTAHIDLLKQIVDDLTRWRGDNEAKSSPFYHPGAFHWLALRPWFCTAIISATRRPHFTLKQYATSCECSLGLNFNYWFKFYVLPRHRRAITGKKEAKAFP